jgi:hypothetical protein
MLSGHSSLIWQKSEYTGQYKTQVPDLGESLQACNSSSSDTKAGGWQVQGQPGLYSETLSQSTKTKQNKTGV